MNLPLKISVYLYMKPLMYNDLKNEKIIVELDSLTNVAEQFKDETDMYCEFMKAQFLKLSGAN